MFYFLIGLLLLPTKLLADICTPSHGNTALVIMDMQQDYIRRKGTENTRSNRSKTNRALSAQESAIREAKKAGIPILFVETGGVGYQSTLPRLKNAARGYDKVTTLEKFDNGILGNSNHNKDEFITYMNQNQIGNIVLAGANGGACIKESIEDLLPQGCNISMINNAVIDFNEKDFIYPYAGFFEGIKRGHCLGRSYCRFRELTSVSAAVPYMTRNSAASELRERLLTPRLPSRGSN